MRTRTAITTTDVVIGLVILLAVIIAAVAVLRMDIRGERSESADGKPADPAAIDPALIHYEESGSGIPVGMRQLRAVAVGLNGRIYVAGDEAVYVFDPDGTKRAEIAPNGRPKCLAVGNAEHEFPGRLYVGMDDHVEVFDADYKRVAAWSTLAKEALFTSIATAEQDVFVADAGNKIVWHYDTSGKLKGRIGEPDEARKIPGFIITSSYFDLAVAPDGLLRVVNPRLLRIEAYTFGGDLESSWGKPGAGVKGFYGCCNPAHFAALPDGRFVTAEKGISRVKIYSAAGDFECVVAGPEQVSAVAADVAADRHGRILILDPVKRSVRIFLRNSDNYSEAK